MSQSLDNLETSKFTGTVGENQIAYGKSFNELSGSSTFYVSESANTLVFEGTTFEVAARDYSKAYRFRTTGSLLDQILVEQEWLLVVILMLTLQGFKHFT